MTAITNNNSIHSEKNQEGPITMSAAKIDEDHFAPVHFLDTAVLSTIFSFLPWHEVLNVRVCRRWKEAAVLAPIRELDVSRCEVGLDLPWITRSLSNIQSFKIDFSGRHETNFMFNPGEEAEAPPVELNPIQKLTNLQHLTLRYVHMDGKYPYIFKFKNLLSLDLEGSFRHRWDLNLLE